MLEAVGWGSWGCLLSVDGWSVHPVWGELPAPLNPHRPPQDPCRNHKTYREVLAKMKPPLIPFIPLILKGAMGDMGGGGGPTAPRGAPLTSPTPLPQI